MHPKHSPQDKQHPTVKFVVVFKSGGKIPVPSIKAAWRVIHEKARTHPRGVSGGIYDGEGTLIETFHEGVKV